MNSLELLIVHLDVWTGGKSLAKYFASWYHAMLITEIMPTLRKDSASDDDEGIF